MADDRDIVVDEIHVWDVMPVGPAGSKAAVVISTADGIEPKRSAVISHGDLVAMALERRFGRLTPPDRLK